MDRMKRLSIIVLALVSFWACNDNGSDSGVTLKGQFDNTNGETMMIGLVKDGDLDNIDSLVIDEKGKFETNLDLQYTDYVVVHFNNSNNFIQLIAEPGQTIKLKGDMVDLSQSYTVNGSKQSALIKEMTLMHQKNVARIDSLGAVYRENQGSEDMESIQAGLDTAFMEIIKDEKAYLKKFIDDNPGSLANIFALYQQMGPRTPVFNLREDLDYFEKVSEQLTDKYPDSELVKSLNELVANAKNPPVDPMDTAKEDSVGAIGSLAPDIELENPDGKVVKLSSLQGKVVLLDFWAAWCRPCRVENPNLVENYKKYNKDGFEIYQVSLDHTRDAWLNAIKDDKLDWYHVSDLKYWQSQAAQQYGIQAIPASFLLDKEGKIIAANLRGSALGNKLAEIFGH